MPRLLAILPGLFVAVAATSLGADAAGDALDRGLRAVQSMAGCYLVDYSYVAVESLKPGYARDARVYDVNRDKSAKEWITAEVLSPHRIRLQRILFLADLGGTIREGSLIKHQSEDWEYDAPFLYEFVAPRSWQVRDLKATPGLWPGGSRISTTGRAISVRRAGRRTRPIRRGRARAMRRFPAARPATCGAPTTTRSTGPRASSRTARAGWNGRTTSRPSTATAPGRRWPVRSARTGRYGSRSPSARPLEPSPLRAERSGIWCARCGTACRPGPRPSSRRRRRASRPAS